jgi:hypothetical protein
MFHIHTFLKSTSTTFTLFTFFIYCCPPTSALPLVWPVLCSCPSLFKYLFVVQWNFCLGVLPVNTLCWSQSNLLHCTFSPFPPELLFNSFQCVL